MRLARIGLLVLLCPSMTTAQVVFYDDFQGYALLPHWNQPRASDWEYNVSSGMLNVTDLFYPSHPKSPANLAAMSALFEPQSDFRMDAWMGWEAGDAPHRLLLEPRSGPAGTLGVASFGYSFGEGFGPDPVIVATAGPIAVTIPAPTAGIYHFAIIRASGQFHFYFDETAVATLPDARSLMVTGVVFDFLGPYPGELGTLHVDRIQVAPAPGASVMLSAFLLVFIKRRRGSFDTDCSILRCHQWRE